MISDLYFDTGWGWTTLSVTSLQAGANYGQYLIERDGKVVLYILLRETLKSLVVVEILKFYYSN